jgi:MFS family permease
MTTPPPTATHVSAPALTGAGRRLILVVAFLGWLCAGVHMAITQQVGRAAAIDLLGRAGSLDSERFQTLVRAKDLTDSERAQLKQWQGPVGRWFTWTQCAFLFGAASGGLLFGWLGDHIGRSKGMSLSILTYSAFAAAAACAQAPWQLAALWFLACAGVGGMWPNGVALVSEAWSGLSRPVVAGVIGTSANVGIFLLSTLVVYKPVEPDDWRWVMLVGAAPLILGVFSLLVVPESPRWLSQRGQNVSMGQATHDVFRPPLLWLTLVGIVLATTPVIGGWGTATWMLPWAEKVGGSSLRAEVLQIRACTGIVGSFLGGWLASVIGRRFSYFLVSAASLAIAQYTFWCLLPTDRIFLFWVAVLGFVSGIYFGWLPLCLPELFPTRVRSTGAGVSFNFGRIATALTLFVAGLLMEFFHEDYARIGRLTSLFFILGMLAICFAPDTSRKQLED